MLKRLLVLIIFISSSAVYGETIYKCKNAQGDVVYSDLPCASGDEKQLHVDESDGSSGLRPAEKEALKSIDERQAKASEAKKHRQEEQAGIEGCAGINILAGKAETFGYSMLVAGGADVVYNRCVFIQAKLDGYYGRAFNDDLQLEIKQRFSGTFADGSTASAQTIKFISGPERIDSASEYEVELCFGVNNSEMAAVACQ